MALLLPSIKLQLNRYGESHKLLVLGIFDWNPVLFSIKPLIEIEIGINALIIRVIFFCSIFTHIETTHMCVRKLFIKCQIKHIKPFNKWLCKGKHIQEFIDI